MGQEPTKHKMKIFITALISCSLMLGAIAMAQQDEEQQKGKKKKSQQASEAQPQATAAARGGQAGAQHGKGMGKAGGPHQEQAATTAAGANANVSATPEKGKRKGRAQERAGATGPAASASVSATEETGKQKGKRAEAAMKKASPSPAATAGTSTAVSGAAGAKPTKPGNVGKNGKQVDVQKIKSQHTSFRAQAQPEKIKSVTFNQNYRIVNAERWQGPQYEVFRTYQPVWHDAGWYRSNFAQVALIGGGYYAFNNGYWYPAWGYDPAAQYYAYDAPIYVGSAARPPDQVIADVQSALQEMGYYQGEVDGLLGPLTREALTAYQSDHGLYATAVIDQPTLDALGIA
jgi:hypothetical protein